MGSEIVRLFNELQDFGPSTRLAQRCSKRLLSIECVIVCKKSLMAKWLKQASQ